MTENAKNKQIIEDLEQIEKAKILGIRKRYYHVSLDNFIAKTPSQIEAKQAVKKIFGDLRDQLLIISGPSRVGKTLLICAGLLMLNIDLQKFYIEEIFFYITMPWLAIRIRSIHSSNATHETEYDALAKLSQAPILVIDDVGRSGDIKAEQVWINYLVLERQANLLPTILVTNEFPVTSLNESIISRATKIIGIEK